MDNPYRLGAESLMDDDHRVIPVTEEDQGEGFKDPVDQHDLLKKKLQKERWKLDRRSRNSQRKKRGPT